MTYSEKRTLQPFGFTVDRLKSELAALRAENEKLHQIVFTVAHLSPATRDYNPGVGAGMLNQLIEAAKAALAKEGK